MAGKHEGGRTDPNAEVNNVFRESINVELSTAKPRALPHGCVPLSQALGLTLPKPSQEMALLVMYYDSIQILGRIDGVFETFLLFLSFPYKVHFPGSKIRSYSQATDVSGWNGSTMKTFSVVDFFFFLTLSPHLDDITSR